MCLWIKIISFVTMKFENANIGIVSCNLHTLNRCVCVGVYVCVCGGHRYPTVRMHSVVSDGCAVSIQRYLSKTVELSHHHSEQRINRVRVYSRSYVRHVCSVYA